MRRIIRPVIIVLSVAYPFLIYWGLQHYPAVNLLPLLLLLVALRWMTVNRTLERAAQAVILVAVVGVALLWGHKLGLKFYPVMVNLGFLGLFAASLVYPPSIVERIARVRDPELSPAGVAYTRKLTLVWIVFFTINGSIAAATALWASDEVWTLYNGFIAYLLIGILVGGEWLLRRRAIGS